MHELIVRHSSHRLAGAHHEVLAQILCASRNERMIGESKQWLGVLDQSYLAFS